MKAKSKLAALVLLGVISSAQAKDGGAGIGPDGLPPGINMLLESFPEGQAPDLSSYLPSGLADRVPADASGGANVPPFKHGWKSWGDQPPGHGHAVTPPIPEPETYALLLAGLGVLAAVKPRKKNDAGG